MDQEYHLPYNQLALMLHYLPQPLRQVSVKGEWELFAHLMNANNFLNIPFFVLFLFLASSSVRTFLANFRPLLHTFPIEIHPNLYKTYGSM